MMKKVFIFVPVILSLLLLCAHFLRYGNLIGVLGSLLLLALLVIRRPWVARLMQGALVLGALEWAHTLYGLVQMRAAHGQPFARLTVILGIVATVTVCSALLFQTRELRRIYRLDRQA